MIFKLIIGIVLLIVLDFGGCSDTDWQTLGTVEEIAWSSGSSQVFLSNGNAYYVVNSSLSDCAKGATLKRAGFLYSCY